MWNIQNKPKKGSAAPLLEWQTGDSERDSEAIWQLLPQDTQNASVLHPEDRPRPSWLTAEWRIGALLLLILAAIGFWTWSVAQEGIAQIEAELRDSVEADLWMTATQTGQDSPKPFTSVQLANLHPLTTTIQLLALQGDSAIVHFVTQSGHDQPSLHQTRFYRQTAGSWIRTKPYANLWGTPQRLESSHFIFKFRQKDARVVAAVASQIDEVYAEVQRNFGLPANTEKLAIEVTVEHVTGAMLTPQWAHEPLVLPSPALYLAPVEVDDNALLAQSIALPLIDFMGGRAIEDHAIPTRWQPLLRGLQLWQLWNLEMPLAHWRHTLVKWLYIDTPEASVELKSMLPDSYTELCAMHRLWMLSPTELGIPLECTAQDAIMWSPKRWARYMPPTHLGQLSMPLDAWEIPYHNESNDRNLASEAVVVANLIEYVVVVYGDEQLPVLLAGLAHYDHWETLVPAVFGVSVEEFEVGWHSYVTEQYKLSQ